MPNLNFALIGCGRIAARHATHMMTFGKLQAVCDIDQEKANAFAKQYNCRVYYHPNDLIRAEKNIDIAAVCTPNGLHAVHSIACLKAGFNVLCEKPLAIKSRDAKEMIKTAEETGKQLFVVKQNRFNPPVAAVKKAIDEGRLGKIFSMQLSCFWNRDAAYYQNSWKGTNALDGGTLYTQFSHFIDLMLWIMGDVEAVETFTANFEHDKIIEFEDSGVVILKFKNGAIGTLNYSVNSYKKNMEGSLTLIAEKGTVKIGGQYLNELEYQQIENYRIVDLPAGNTANDYGSYRGSMSNHDKVYENIVCALKQNGKLQVSAFEAMKTVEIIEKIYENKS